MRILLDARWLTQGPPSGRNVVRGLISQWSRSFPTDHLLLSVPRKQHVDALTWLAQSEISADLVTPRLGFNHAASIIGGTWEETRHDVHLTQNFSNPLDGRRSIVYVHDAIFEDHPEWFTLSERFYLKGISATVRHARVVLVSSRSEQSRIQRVWPWSVGRTEVVGYGISVGLDSAAPSRPVFLTQGTSRYALAVGRINSRKNLASLIEAWRLLSPNDTKLIIVGEKNGLVDSSLERASFESVVFTGHITDSDLAWLYTHSDLFIFPSLDEGYGLPLVEAARFGTRSIASDIPPFRELGLAVDYFDPNDIGSIAASITRALGSHAGQRTNVRLPNWHDVVLRIRDLAVQRL